MQQGNKNPQDYRACVGIMLSDASSRIFVGQRFDSSIEAWQMPQGGIDEGEDVLTAAYRELAEETGITSEKVTLRHEFADEFYYDLPAELQNKLWGGKFKGQRQKWFLFEFAGVEADINIATETPEFKEYKWVSPEELPEIIVPFKKEIYQKLADEFLRLYK